MTGLDWVPVVCLAAHECSSCHGAIKPGQHARVSVLQAYRHVVCPPEERL